MADFGAGMVERESRERVRKERSEKKTMAAVSVDVPPFQKKCRKNLSFLPRPLFL